MPVIEDLNPTPEESALLHEVLKYSREREPWTQAGTIWKNDKAYFNYLRGAYRKLWTRYPVRVQFKNKLRYRAQVYDDYGKPVKFKTGTKRDQFKTRWVLDCEVCHDTFPQNQIEIDHLDPTGSCRTNLEGAVFFYKLLCDEKDMRAVCKPCHDEITYAERHGLTIEQAAREKAAIGWLDQYSPVEQKEQLTEAGFGPKDINNAANRRKSYVSYLEGL